MSSLMVNKNINAYLMNSQAKESTQSLDSQIKFEYYAKEDDDNDDDDTSYI